MLGWLKSTLEGVTQNGNEGKPEEEPGGETSSGLFRCLECGTVYIDTEKQTCSQCESAVEQVSASFDESDTAESVTH